MVHFVIQPSIYPVWYRTKYIKITMMSSYTIFPMVSIQQTYSNSLMTLLRTNQRKILTHQHKTTQKPVTRRRIPRGTLGWLIATLNNSLSSFSLAFSSSFFFCDRIKVKRQYICNKTQKYNTTIALAIIRSSIFISSIQTWIVTRVTSLYSFCPVWA